MLTANLHHSCDWISTTLKVKGYGRSAVPFTGGTIACSGTGFLMARKDLAQANVSHRQAPAETAAKAGRDHQIGAGPRQQPRQGLDQLLLPHPRLYQEEFMERSGVQKGLERSPVAKLPWPREPFENSILLGESKKENRLHQLSNSRICSKSFSISAR